MTNVVIVGCGVVGAAIAYELSDVEGLAVTVLDRQQPAQAATGAALGVLMAVISQKTKGNNLRMRLTGIERYNAWIPALEAITGQTILFNKHGLLRLCFEGEPLERWHKLVEIRRSKGFQLEMLDRAQLAANYPQLGLERVTAAVYSPDDRQVDPTALTQALVAAAAQKGVTFQFDTNVEGVECCDRSHLLSETALQLCQQIQTTKGTLPTDWLVIAAGLGSTPLTATLQQPVDLRPVLGQAIHVRLPYPLKTLQPQPVITGEDVHIVPLSGKDYWIGATVEFPTGTLASTPDAMALETVMQQAIALCPAFSEAAIIRAWSGLRPRPEGRPAPIVEHLSGYGNVLLATGHYRNGVLLAPATAEKIRQLIGVG
ncbi:FAD-binding oxidoreductase [Leptolyngbya sp. FACHB-321]|uniref:NAD(P)/FAD-dependent oxidoreductase n=1 Tax=Leptolyngbya sp. FACHB-321 TaxID=2692807 RepID=UPI001686FA9A|nr:FAD-dependent oxidoreductase [Leptolyngbya sp. FACHB-321]MBD2037315.1 FAD-binding oxidoreductase [Leptolyngbya sp. FACHB-321]